MEERALEVGDGRGDEGWPPCLSISEVCRLGPIDGAGILRLCAEAWASVKRASCDASSVRAYLHVADDRSQPINPSSPPTIATCWKLIQTRHYTLDFSLNTARMIQQTGMLGEGGCLIQKSSMSSKPILTT